MSLHTSLALACALALTGCKKEPEASQPRTAQSAPAPTKAPPKAAPQPAASQPTPAAPTLPTAAELLALIDKATRIEAKSGVMQKPEWSKDLTKEDIASLKAGIGEATEFSRSLPRCLPTVVATLYQQDKVLATLGAFCDRGTFTGPVRFDINTTKGRFTPQDVAKIGAALESPVDK